MPKNNKIQIVEVGPRDGLQNEPHLKEALANGSINQEDLINLRTSFIRALHATGLRTIEAGAFVHPKYVPLMAGTDQVLARLHDLNDTRFPVLVPNLKGLFSAATASAQEIAVFISASEEYSQANLKCSVEESLKRVQEIMDAPERSGMRVRGYLSCIAGHKRPDDIPLEAVQKLTQALLDMGCDEVSLGDTYGIGRPDQIGEIVKALTKTLPIERLAAHFHDGGNGIQNTRTFIEEGGRVIDCSISGLGGAVTTNDAPGNISTQEGVALAHDMGFNTGIDQKKLEITGLQITSKLIMHS